MGSVSPAIQPTLYFGYGSNLWLHQMSQRCPTSSYSGIAVLPSYRWMINSRGYANIVRAAPSSEDNQYSNVTYGVVYTLQSSDEARLDRNEGVPWAYTKENLEVEFWPSTNSSERVDLNKPSQKMKMLVYINREDIEDDRPKKEYIYRMNMGIRDALSSGVPKGYVDGVMRKFIPEGGAEEVRRVALQQALEFNDER